jgi:hypothetical protein
MLVILIGATLLIATVALTSFASANITVTRFQTTGSRSDAVRPSHQAVDHLARHLKATGEAKPPEPDEKEFRARYVVIFANRVYVNQLFRLRVRVGGEGLTDITASGERVAARGLLAFTHRWYPENAADPVPNPKIRVDLKFAQGDFQVVDKSQTKHLLENMATAFDFLVKPQKSEDCSLVVEISYVGLRWRPATVTEISETVDGTKTSHTTKMTPPGFEEHVAPLVREQLIVQTKSFLNLNAASLNLLSKGLAILLSAVYVGLAIGLDLTDSVLDSVIVGLGGITSMLGVPVAAELWKNVQVEAELEATQET